MGGSPPSPASRNPRAHGSRAAQSEILALRASSSRVQAILAKHAELREAAAHCNLFTSEQLAPSSSTSRDRTDSNFPGVLRLSSLVGGATSSMLQVRGGRNALQRAEIPLNPHARQEVAGPSNTTLEPLQTLELSPERRRPRSPDPGQLPVPGKDSMLKRREPASGRRVCRERSYDSDIEPRRKKKAPPSHASADPRHSAGSGSQGRSASESFSDGSSGRQNRSKSEPQPSERANPNASKSLHEETLRHEITSLGQHIQRKEREYSEQHGQAKLERDMRRLEQLGRQLSGFLASGFKTEGEA
jgi:hypothetical protein